MGLTVAGALLGGSAIAGVGSLLGGFLNSSGQSSANAANLQIARETFAHNKQMWELENEYNTPRNQMARYRDAGLNPHMMFGSVTPGNANNAPTMDAPRMENAYAGLANGITSGASAVGNALMQTKLIDAQINKTNAEAENLLAGAGLHRSNMALTDSKVGTEIQNQAYMTAKAMRERLGANLDNALYDVTIAIENQKLRNMSVQEQDMYSQMVARDVENMLKKAKITSEQFYRELSRLQYELDAEIKRGHLSLSEQNYALDYSRHLTQMKQWSNEYLLKKNQYKFDKWYRESNFEVDKEMKNEIMRKMKRDYWLPW